MTYTTTHLGISVLLVYYILPKKTRAYLRENPKILLITSLGAVIPDLDLFTSGHRAYLHSVFYPLILLLIAPSLERFLKRDRLSIQIRIFAIFWFTHMMYDTTFGPIAIFFPLDGRFYDVSAGILFDLTTAQITPKGLFFSVDFVDQRTGINTFFVNWTPEQRVQTFGAQILAWSITDFFVHATIILWYVGFVIVPSIPQLNRNRSIKEDKGITDFGFPVWMKTWGYPLLLLLLTSAFFLGGPIHGETWEETSSVGNELGISNDFIELYGSLEISSPQNSFLKSVVKAQGEDLNYSVFAMNVSLSQKEQMDLTSQDLLDSHDKGTVSHEELILQYQNFVQSYIPIDQSQIVDSNSTPTWEFNSEGGKFYLVYGLYTWNSSLSFRNSFRIDQNWVIPLESTYDLGWIFTIITGLTTIVSFGVILRKEIRIG